jgi:hypothetical protein
VLLVIAAVIGVAVLELVEHLRSSQERQRLLAENSTDLVAVLAPDSTITYASLSRTDGRAHRSQRDGTGVPDPRDS